MITVQNLHITQVALRDSVVVTVAGEVDLSTAGLLTQGLTAVGLISQPPRTLVDLSAVTFFGAAGLTSLVMARPPLPGPRHRLTDRGESPRGTPAARNHWTDRDPAGRTGPSARLGQTDTHDTDHPRHPRRRQTNPHGRPPQHRQETGREPTDLFGPRWQTRRLTILSGLCLGEQQDLATAGFEPAHLTESTKDSDRMEQRVRRWTASIPSTSARFKTAAAHPSSRLAPRAPGPRCPRR